MLKTNKKYFFVFKFPFFCVLFFQGFCQRSTACFQVANSAPSQYKYTQIIKLNNGVLGYH